VRPYRHAQPNDRHTLSIRHVEQSPRSPPQTEATAGAILDPRARFFNPSRQPLGCGPGRQPIGERKR
jgi:hypothetical protein